MGTDYDIRLASGTFWVLIVITMGPKVVQHSTPTIKNMSPETLMTKPNSEFGFKLRHRDAEDLYLNLAILGFVVQCVCIPSCIEYRILYLFSESNLVRAVQFMFCKNSNNTVMACHLDSSVDIFQALGRSESAVYIFIFMLHCMRLIMNFAVVGEYLSQRH